MRILIIFILSTYTLYSMEKNNIADIRPTKKEFNEYLKEEQSLIILLKNAQTPEQLQSILNFFEKYSFFVQWRAVDFIRIVQNNSYLISQAQIVQILIYFNQLFTDRLPIIEAPAIQHSPLNKRHTIAKIETKDLPEKKKSKKKVSFDEKVTTWFDTLGKDLKKILNKK